MFEGHFLFYISRFVIDLVSYCVTGVIFYNAVYGIIIDTFTEVRTANDDIGKILC